MLSSSAPLIVRHSVSDQVLAELRRRILHGVFPEHSTLPESQCAESLGVSRVPVREALIQLERDGLLAADVRGKTVVRAFGAQDHSEISSVRLELEGLAARLAATVRTAKDIFILHQNIEAFDAATSPEELARLDVEFHQRLCASAHQEWLAVAWEAIRWPFEAILVRNFRNYVEATSIADSKASTADHGRILDAMVSQDAALAETLLRQHISRWGEWTPSA